MYNVNIFRALTLGHCVSLQSYDSTVRAAITFTKQPRQQSPRQHDFTFHAQEKRPSSWLSASSPRPACGPAEQVPACF